MSFAYEKPKTGAELVSILRDAGPKAALLGGGTDLLIQLRARAHRPELLVDVKGIDEHDALEHRADGSIWIGAAVTMNRIVDDKRLRPIYVGLTDGAHSVGTYAIRNRATVVGNVANASPCADTVPALSVLGAEVVLRGPQGERKVAVPSFIINVRKTLRQTDEYVAGIVIPPQSTDTRTWFGKHQRVRGHDLALANAALLHDPATKRLRVAVGSCSPVPTLLVLDDLDASRDAQQAAQRAMQAITPICDVRASAEYRIDMTGVLVRRLFDNLKG